MKHDLKLLIEGPELSYTGMTLCHTCALKIISQAINHNKTLVTAGPGKNLLLIVTWLEIFAHLMIQSRTVPSSQSTTFSYFFSILYNSS